MCDVDGLEFLKRELMGFGVDGYRRSEFNIKGKPGKVK